jgi:hypothetical protein
MAIGGPGPPLAAGEELCQEARAGGGKEGRLEGRCSREGRLPVAGRAGARAVRTTREEPDHQGQEEEKGAASPVHA